MRIISDRNLEEMIIVDNSIISFAFQIENGIPICSYFAKSMNDSELLFLITYLEEIYHQEDMRDANKKTFKLQDIMM